MGIRYFPPLKNGKKNKEKKIAEKEQPSEGSQSWDKKRLTANPISVKNI